MKVDGPAPELIPVTLIHRPAQGLPVYLTLPLNAQASMGDISESLGPSLRPAESARAAGGRQSQKSHQGFIVLPLLSQGRELGFCMPPCFPPHKALH